MFDKHLSIFFHTMTFTCNQNSFLTNSLQNTLFYVAWKKVSNLGLKRHEAELCEVVWSCWILAGTGTRCRIRRSRASQTCSMGDMSSDYAGRARTGMFSASRNCVQILAAWGRALSCCNMRWWSWMNGTTMGLRISSRYLCAFKMPSIKCTCVRCP